MPDDAHKVSIAHALHGVGRQAEVLVPEGTTFRPGRFGRMFPNLPPLKVSDDAIAALAEVMVDRSDVSGDNEKILAGYTYLGQFVDHDLSFDPTPIPEQRIDPAAIYNFRTPRLDLDSIYGLGPRGQPFLYDQYRLGADNAPHCFLLGGETGLHHDLPRNDQGMALLGDPRNDENLIVAQLHLAFLKFHNAVVRHLGADEPGVFEKARELVTWHYQWIVLNELLEKILEEGAVERALTRSHPLLRFQWEAFIPIELSMAAFRFGHTMVRPGYSLNRGQTGLRLAELFFLTGPKKRREDQGGELSVPLTRNKAVNWRLFFDFEDLEPDLQKFKNFSRKLDPFLTSEMHDLLKHTKVQEAPANLAIRNLRRGMRAGLPSGQAIARLLNLTELDREALTSGVDGQVVKAKGLDKETPLWYYILKEAQILGNGERLGPVGSTIIAESFVRLLQADPTSYLARHPEWKPTLGKNGEFSMVDLLRFTERYMRVIDPHYTQPPPQ